MPSAFSNTPEADGAEIVELGRAKSATRQASEINVSLQRNFSKLRIGIQLSIAIHGALFIATGAAMIKANEYYKREAIINQEVSVTWKR